MTSAVTSMPCALAHRTTSTVPAVDDVRHVDARPGVPGEHDVAGDDRLLGDAGPAGQPEPARHLALVAAGVGAGERGSWACWEMTPPKGLTYSSARRITRASCTQWPSSLKTRTPARECVHEPELGELGTREALGHGADRHDLGQAAGAAEVEHALGGLGRVGDGARVGHGEDRRVAARRSGCRAAGDGLGVLAAGLAQVHVEVDEAGQGDEAVGVEHLDSPVATHGADLADDAVLDEQVGRLGTEQAGRRGSAGGSSRGSVGRGSGQWGRGVSSPASRW